MRIALPLAIGKRTLVHYSQLSSLSCSWSLRMASTTTRVCDPALLAHIPADGSCVALTTLASRLSDDFLDSLNMGLKQYCQLHPDVLFIRKDGPTGAFVVSRTISGDHVVAGPTQTLFSSAPTASSSSSSLPSLRIPPPPSVPVEPPKKNFEGIKSHPKPVSLSPTAPAPPPPEAPLDKEFAAQPTKNQEQQRAPKAKSVEELMRTFPNPSKEFNPPPKAFFRDTWGTTQVPRDLVEELGTLFYDASVSDSQAEPSLLQDPQPTNTTTESPTESPSEQQGITCWCQGSQAQSIRQFLARTCASQQDAIRAVESLQTFLGSERPHSRAEESSSSAPAAEPVPSTSPALPSAAPVALVDVLKLYQIFSAAHSSEPSTPSTLERWIRDVLCPYVDAFRVVLLDKASLQRVVAAADAASASTAVAAVPEEGTSSSEAAEATAPLSVWYGRDAVQKLNEGSLSCILPSVDGDGIPSVEVLVATANDDAHLPQQQQQQLVGGNRLTTLQITLPCRDGIDARQPPKRGAVKEEFVLLCGIHPSTVAWYPKSPADEKEGDPAVDPEAVPQEFDAYRLSRILSATKSLPWSVVLRESSTLVMSNLFAIVWSFPQLFALDDAHQPTGVRFLVSSCFIPSDVRTMDPQEVAKYVEYFRQAGKNSSNRKRVFGTDHRRYYQRIAHLQAGGVTPYNDPTVAAYALYDALGNDIKILTGNTQTLFPPEAQMGINTRSKKFLNSYPHLFRVEYQPPEYVLARVDNASFPIEPNLVEMTTQDLVKEVEGVLLLRKHMRKTKPLYLCSISSYLSKAAVKKIRSMGSLEHFAKTYLSHFATLSKRDPFSHVVVTIIGEEGTGKGNEDL